MHGEKQHILVVVVFFSFGCWFRVMNMSQREGEIYETE